MFGNALAHIVNVEISHPAIAAPLAAGLESGAPYMVYEYVEGESLDVALRREARPREAAQWIAQLAGAVDAAHARGLEHGALHLRDVLVSSEGVCVTGFGIPRALEHVQLGIPVRRPYAAPEMMAGRRWGPPADRFAVAVLAYELLTGTRPAGDGDEAIADLRELRPDVADPAGLQQAFRNALADDPAIRSASATAFATALARAVGDEPRAGAPSPSTRAREPEADPAGLLGDVPDAEGAGAGKVGSTAGEAFGAREFEGPAGRGLVDSEDEPSLPVQIALPDDAVAAGEDRPGDSEDPHDDAGRVRGERRARSQRSSRSKRRSRRGGPRRRTGPVVAVRDDVHFDPLDDSGAIEPAVEQPGYDDDVPPPPSPTSMRAMAPVIAAMAVGVLLAYLVVRGLGTASDETTGDAGQSPENAQVDVGGAADDAAASGEQSPAAAAGGPMILVEEPIVAVGDPPPAGAEPVPAAEPPEFGTPAPDGARPADSPPRRPGSPNDDRGVSESMPATAGSPPSTPVAEAPSATRRTTPPVRSGPAASADDEPPPPAAAGSGSLLVRSRPPGATVRVDGVAVGVTPMEVSDVAFGTHLVRIELPGYRPWVSEVDVAGTEQIRVGASLQPGGER